MAMNLRLTEAEAAALRRQAQEEERSMQAVARTAIVQYVSDRPARLRAAVERIRTEDAELLDYLAVEHVLEIAAGMLPAVSIHDPGLLASTVARPQTSVAGQEAYSRFAEKAAALMHSLARNHPLVDGNKRLAWAATRVCCLLNGHDLSLTVDEAEELVV